jgi:hypothetical protein
VKKRRFRWFVAVSRPGHRRVAVAVCANGGEPLGPDDAVAVPDIGVCCRSCAALLSPAWPAPPPGALPS